MMRITSEQIQEIEYIINQSMNGFHVLFDNETIKKFCRGVTDEDDIFNEERARKTEKLVEIFISTPTIQARKVLFNSMTDEEKSLLVRTYFNIVENNILNSRRAIN